jgi:PAS domain S-box-containing protein
MITKEKNFKAFAKGFPAGAFRTDATGFCNFVSAGWTEITGLSLQQALGDGWVRNLHSEDQERVAEEWSYAVDNGLPFYSEYRFHHADGKTTWVLGQAEVETDSSGNICGYIGTISDFTEHKRTEERFKSSHLLLGAIHNAQTQYIANGSGKQIFDDLLNNILELTQSEYGFIGEIFHEPEGQPYMKTRALTNIAWNEETHTLYNQYAETGMEWRGMDTLFGAAIMNEEPVISNDPANDPRSGGLPKGHPSLNAFLGLPFFHGEAMIGLMGIANRPGGYDERLVEYLQPFLVTCSNLVQAYRNSERRKLAEEALKEREKKYKEINDQMRLILQGTSAVSGEAFSKSLVRQLACALKVRHAMVGELIGENKDKLRTLAFWSDEKFLDSFDYEIAGTPCEKVLEGKSLLCQKDVQKMFPEDEHLSAMGIESYFGMPLFDNSGQQMGILNVCHDKPVDDSFNGQMILSMFAARAEMEIQRQKAEDALKASEQRFKDVLENTTSIMYIKDLTGHYIQVNPQFEKLIHLKNNQIARKTDHQIFPKEVADAFTTNDRKVIMAGKPMEFEEVIQWGDGLHTYISIKFPLKNSHGNIYAVCGISTDITKRKQAHSLIVEQNQILELMATGCSLQTTLDTVVEMVEEHIGDTFASVLVLDDSGKHLSTASALNLPQGYIEAIEGFTIGPCVGSCGTAAYLKEMVIVDDINDDPLWADFKGIALKYGFKSCWSVPMLSSDERVLGTLGLYFKNSRRPSQGELEFIKSSAQLAGLAIGRKQAEERIKNSLEEKELLLKEIHHRTKNNMQIVSSLLWLQSKDIEDEQYRELFQDCSNRVLSMALVHEKMYESPDFLGVDFKKYLVSLVGELAASYGLEPDQIKLVVDANNLSLGLKSGIPCGLLIQELVCNSMKHGFPNGKKGEIRISIRPLDESKVEMRVSDSGVGFPEGFDIKNSKSLGLQLVTMLVEKQLGGTLEFHGNGRAEFKLVFEREKS